MKVERLNKKELEAYCESLGIEIKNKNKQELKKAVYKHERNIIDEAIASGKCLDLLKEKIGALADEYAKNLNEKIVARKEEMKGDDNHHYLIYRVLGISNDEGILIDEYQNTGRFLYKYAGSFLEEAASMCMFFANSKGGKVLIDNTQGKKPKTFEIDFLNGNDAIELKWRDATTDGDHITKEHTRVRAIQSHGYKPVRVMFYYPQREQAIKIQETLKTIYNGVDGEYYSGDDAWDYLLKVSGYDLKQILTDIAARKK
ncbi:ApaLI family restriction endonuclease [Desulforhopalus vacuolatus]|uniref:ApaLI family restriction endonuclease n=1 Tax=Desulforhopalus vacuolatus TaxID=40414 RepID=UPI001963F41D|nr:ApaLI family restriction endonuclease [Desulforhopalus vacuolatus]MBM9520554.1 ApaLI family restriction endonuclease [Desulforhopalus vacuolatus]